jgi:hypothetical protein
MSNTTRSNSRFEKYSEEEEKKQILFEIFIAINCVRLLTRILPYIFEEPEWRGFFWSDIPTAQQPITTNDVRRNVYLAKMDFCLFVGTRE